MKQTWRFVLFFVFVLALSAVFILWLQSLKLGIVYFIAAIAVVVAIIFGLLFLRGKASNG